ncbi:MAG: low molecular weight phosphotyrosine protein phosphatase [Vannielia sp.]|uniref:low molecular weight protein-tyrosine-phosphatase n=1 Tax=Rhodobacterales TaxID=204455 RepID=UPI0020959774|nr:low molecular weight protein-tyrosine-phosphatase [Oceanicola sp. 502str15]MCO6381324.1 low molecular weight phosphotyrosine protein phosphatase [Oceanicola sp. 502str15]
MTHRVIFVCLGNICRSPTAHGIFEAKAREAGLDVVVEGAGTGGWHVGHPPDARMQAAAKAAGYDLSHLRAQKFVAADFDRFDAIHAMDRQNLADIEALRPAGNTTPVTLFLSHGPSGRDEVPDPYYEGGFDAVVEMVAQTCDALVREISGAR